MLLSGETFSIIPKQIVTATLRLYDQNNLARFLASQFGESTSKRLVNKFNIGTATSGSILWSQDAAGRFRTGRIITVNAANCRIISEDEEPIHEKLQSMFNLGFTYCSCLFGEHQLHKTLFLPKGLVESELLAIMLSALVPEVTWFAYRRGEKIDFNKLATMTCDVPFLILPRWDSYGEMENGIKGHSSEYVVLTNILCDLYPSLDTGGFLVQHLQSIQLLTRVKQVVSSSLTDRR